MAAKPEGWIFDGTHLIRRVRWGDEWRNLVTDRVASGAGANYTEVKIDEEVLKKLSQQKDQTKGEKEG